MENQAHSFACLARNSKEPKCIGEGVCIYSTNMPGRDGIENQIFELQRSSRALQPVGDPVREPPTERVAYALQDNAVGVLTPRTQAQISALALVVVCRRCDASWWSHTTWDRRGLNMPHERLLVHKLGGLLSDLCIRPNFVRIACATRRGPVRF